jgi:hypothetical protein
MGIHREGVAGGQEQGRPGCGGDIPAQDPVEALVAFGLKLGSFVVADGTVVAIRCAL